MVRRKVLRGLAIIGLAVSAICFLHALETFVPDISSDTKKTWVQLGGYLFTFSASLASALWISPTTRELDVHNSERSRRRYEGAISVLKRTHRVLKSSESMAAIASSNPARLPSTGADDFSELAAFCACWRENDHFEIWQAPEKDTLEAANLAIFELLLSFEMKDPNKELIASQLKEVTRALSAVETVLRRITAG